MFDEEELDKWFQEKFYRDYSKHQPDHIDNPEHNSNIKPLDHPMCRCRIMVFMPDITKKLVEEYFTESRKSLIWIN